VRIYSVGHSNRTAEELLALLRGVDVTALADVRRIPASGRHPQFGRGALDAALEGAGIAYHWLGEGLGGLRAPVGPSGSSPNRALQDQALRAYADAFETPVFQRDLEALEALAARATTALLCAERDWRHCHRQLLCDVLVARGGRVVHLWDAERSEPHALHEWARVEGGRVTYPGLL
jgi:uncharacterized protein (DUF488 family)